MSNQSATGANNSSEPPLPHPGAPPDAERAKQPPLPEPPYQPYAKKPALPEASYEPHKGMWSLGQLSSEIVREFEQAGCGRFLRLF